MEKFFFGVGSKPPEGFQATPGGAGSGEA
jgi:hypothetical protein